MEENKKPVIATKCPKCGQVVKFYSPGQGGLVKVKCPHLECGQTFGVKITEKQIRMGMDGNSEKSSHPATDPIIPTNGTPSGVVARLLQKKRHFYNKDKYYGLQLGSNTIGM